MEWQFAAENQIFLFSFETKKKKESLKIFPRLELKLVNPLIQDYSL